MAEDRRAHDRLDALEAAYRLLGQELKANAVLTQAIADNTSELVIMIKSAKGLRNFLLWVTPPMAILSGLWYWLKGH